MNPHSFSNLSLSAKQLSNLDRLNDHNMTSVQVAALPREARIVQTWTGCWKMVGFALVLLVLIGCSSTPKSNNENWLDIFNSATNQKVGGDSVSYGIERVESDYDRLTALTQELDGLMNEIALMKRTFVYNQREYLSEQENRQIEFVLFRFMNARDALWDMLDRYRQDTATDSITQTKGAVIGMSAGLKLSYYSSYFTALFIDQKSVIKKINTAHPTYEIPEGLYDLIYNSITDLDHLELLDVAWYLFCKELDDSNSELFAMRKSDPHSQHLIAQMDRLYAVAHVQVEYILLSRGGSVSHLRNRLHHSHIAEIGDAISNQIDHDLYKTKGLIFKDVARIKNPTKHILQFSDPQVERIKALLQPGDILLTYTAGYMSNIFLPGSFKHGIVYIGTVEDRRAAGLTDAVLAQRAISERQEKMLIKQVSQAELPDGFPVNIVEAVAEGVILNSLDKLLATHINRLAVIRPKITQQERLDQLVSVFQYIKTPYDFNFDFQDDAYQCCTELVYRTLNNKGTVDFKLVKKRGLWILAADDLLRYYLGENPEAFEFILLADHSSDPDDHRAVIQTGSAGRNALYKLIEKEEKDDQAGSAVE